jgi:hypothetical protein
MDAAAVNGLTAALQALVQPGARGAVQNVLLSPPEKFDFSEPRKWDTWCSNFERYRNASGLKERPQQEQIDTFVYCMGAEANEMFTALHPQPTNPGEELTYENVKNAFATFFVAKKNPFYEQCMMFRRRQRDDESA